MDARSRFPIRRAIHPTASVSFQMVRILDRARIRRVSWMIEKSVTLLLRTTCSLFGTRLLVSSGKPSIEGNGAYASFRIVANFLFSALQDHLGLKPVGFL